MEKENLEFEVNNGRPAIIKVIGVGGGGSNAVNHMSRQGIRGVDFVVCNTDIQALEMSPVRTKVQLGPDLTEGLGAGSVPDRGREAAMENINDIKSLLQNNTKMVFITAGMGGGTGTGAAPVIANIAKGMNILTVGIVTIPFAWEGKRRMNQAIEGLAELQQSVDTLLVINNDKLREIYGDLKLTNAYSKADDILTVAARSIAEIITVTGYVNVDFADVVTVLKNSGVAIMGRAMAAGTDRARMAIELALDSPLLNDNNITGARHILLNITSGNDEISMDELNEITDFIQNRAGSTADIIFGTGHDESLGENICITLIATGFKKNDELVKEEKSKHRQVWQLDKTPMPELTTPPPTAEVKEKISINVADTTIEAVTPNVADQKIIDVPAEPIVKHNLHDIVDAPATPISEPARVEISDVENTFVFDLSTPQLEEMHEPEISFDEVEAPETTASSSMSLSINEKFAASASHATNESMDESINDKFQKTKDRIQKLRELSFRLGQGNSTNDMDSIPAYERRNVNLSNTPHSSDSNVSRYTVGPDNNTGSNLRENNSFLHDNVD